jgi:hypothetical protein
MPPIVSEPAITVLYARVKVIEGMTKDNANATIPKATKMITGGIFRSREVMTELERYGVSLNQNNWHVEQFNYILDVRYRCVLDLRNFPVIGANGSIEVG